VGDRLVEIDGEKILVASDFDMILTLNKGDTHDVVVERNGQLVEINNLQMEKHQFPNEEVPRFGFSFSNVEATFGNKISYVWKNSCNVVRTVRLSLQMIVRGQAGLKDMTGPVGIVQIMADTAAASETALDAFLDMLYFGAFIAINLAVMNLLPIPALDGGRAVGLLLTTGIEAVTKKKLDPKYEGYVHGVGMILLLALMAVILFKDIFTIVKG
jgi:regulator of sigma E protease